MKEVSLKNTIYITDRLLNLMSRLCNEEKPDRFLALYDLARKMRACMAALIPIEKYDLLCVPINLLYRCMISDLMTSLLISLMNDKEYEQVMHILDVQYTKSLIKVMDAEINVKKSLYPEESNTFDGWKMDYQNKHYNDFAECLKTEKGEPWKEQPKKPIKINGIDFNGSIDKMYEVLLTYEEVKDIACIYKYYKIFSQSEHFSLRNRVFIYKQDLHDIYYNKTRGLIYLGEEFIYNKYVSQ